MRKKLIQWKIISTSIILIFLISCSTSKNGNDESITIKYLLDDFISYYKDYEPNRPLQGIIIYVEGHKKKMKVSISDAPFEVVKGEFKNAETNYISGAYNGIRCQLYYSGTNKFSNLLKEIDSNKVIADSENPDINLGLLEYEPKIFIKYDMDKITKNIQYSNGNMVTKKIDIFLH